MTPRYQVEAAIARLEELIRSKQSDMIRLANSDFAHVMVGDIDRLGHENGAYKNAITILRAECAGILRGEQA